MLRSTVSWSTVPVPCPAWHTAGPTGRNCCACVSGTPRLVKLLEGTGTSEKCLAFCLCLWSWKLWGYSGGLRD